MYSVKFYDEAIQDIALLKKNELAAVFKKLTRLIEELAEHPKTGTGQPEQMKHDYTGFWSRRITTKHRLVYRIEETTKIVFIVSAYGHYGDK